MSYDFSVENFKDIWNCNSALARIVPSLGRRKTIPNRSRYAFNFAGRVLGKRKAVELEILRQPLKTDNILIDMGHINTPWLFLIYFLNSCSYRLKARTAVSAVLIGSS